MPKYAMDFQSLTTVRHIDNNGHLIVDRTCITKAAINPYYGKEIPNWQALGLDPNKVYMLLRCPTELQRALPTFQGLQLLERHTPVSAEEPEKDSTVGSIGTVVEMDGDNVYSSLRVYDQNAIDLIESEKLNQLSAGYAYTADMTGGEWNGEHYDGVMRNIHGNHVALVERGRIGKDAIIADEMPNEIEEFLMSKKIALKKGSLSKLQEQLGMDSAEELKKTIIAVVGQLAHDEDVEDNDYLIGFNLDIDRLIYGEILVNWPMKVLCRDDCKGICKVCGMNLNKGDCNCQRTELDPRMAAIQDVFNKFKEV
mgnify:CR=1 FL=1